MLKQSLKQQAEAESEVGAFMTGLTGAVLAQPAVHAAAMEVTRTGDAAVPARLSAPPVSTMSDA